MTEPPPTADCGLDEWRAPIRKTVSEHEAKCRLGYNCATTLFLGKPANRSVSIQHVTGTRRPAYLPYSNKTGDPGGVRGCAGAGVRLILILCGYIFNMDMPRMDQLAMMVDASFGELYSVSVPWYASSGPHTAKLMIHHIDPISDLLSGEVLVT